MRIPDFTPVEVFDEFLTVVQVGPDELREVAKHPHLIRVHHMNAVSEVGDKRLTFLVEEGLRSRDSAVVLAAARACVRLKLFEMGALVARVAEGIDNTGHKDCVMGCAAYLTEGDRGLSMILANSPLAPFVVTTLLSTLEFDDVDIELVLGSFIHLAQWNTSHMNEHVLDWWHKSMMPDAINAMARALPQVLNKIRDHGDQRSEIRRALTVLKSNPLMRKFDRDTKGELSTIERAIMQD